MSGRVVVLGGGPIGTRIALALLALEYNVAQAEADSIEIAVRQRHVNDSVWASAFSKRDSGYPGYQPHLYSRKQLQKLVVPKHSRSHRKGKRR